MIMSTEYQKLLQCKTSTLPVTEENKIVNKTDHFLLTKANTNWKATTWCSKSRERLQYGDYNRLNIIVGDNNVSIEKSLGENARVLFDYLEKKKLAKYIIKL